MNTENLESFNSDNFNRRIIAENLTKIIESKNKPMVISLDSDWGTGKTTFINMWRNMLNTKGEYNTKFKTLYFNAWENDYIKDPLLAIFSELELQIKDENPAIIQTIDKVKTKIKPYTKAATIAGIKVLTGGVLNLDGVNLGDFNETQLIDLAGKLGDLAIKEILTSKQVRNELKNEMEDYQKSSGKKIIFFIDELDRCRPNFAIELLEVIKHLFNIDNFIFILSIDKEQLSHSLSTIYGQDMDTIGYLRRFFDLDYKLPKIDRRHYTDVKNSTVFKKYINTEYMQIFLRELFADYNFSLRDIDKTYYYIELLLPLIKEFNKSDEEYTNIYIVTISYLYSVLIITKIKNFNLYKKIIDADYNVEEVLEYFHIPKFDYYDEYIGDYHKDVLTAVTMPIVKQYLSLNLEIRNVKDSYKFELDNYSVGLKTGNQFYTGDLRFDLIDLFSNPSLNIINKLEFIENF